MKPEDVATVRSNKLLARLEIDDLVVILREKRLRWFGHIERSIGAIKTCRYMIEGGGGGGGGELPHGFTNWLSLHCGGFLVEIWGRGHDYK